ncbi:stress-responsive transcription factor hsf1 [Podila verticillata]|nr:stress-responsive transcription factor hsf1 [Podila verticillata]
MAPSSTSTSANGNANTNANSLMSPVTRAAMSLIDTADTGSPGTLHTSDAAMALLQAASNNTSDSSNTSQIQGPSTALPSASNMLINGGSSKSSSNRGSSTLQQHPRPSSTARGNVAAFLTKLYNMVGDEGSNNLIRWSDDGHSFIVIRHVEFAKEVLPKFFKHNNFSSFVRQLNMYGFHKVPHLQQGVLMPDADSEQWEFSNPHFQKNQPDLLCLVSRKKASNGNEDKDALTLDLGHILSEVTAIKKHQIAISSDLKNIERDHQSLWQESIAARERHQRQQDTIDKILRFLASVFSGEKKRAIVPNKKPRLTITEGDLDEEFQRELSQVSESEHEEDVTKLLGSKRKRAMVDSNADYIFPEMEQHTDSGSNSTFNISEMTPATLALLANANQSVKTELTSPTLNPILPNSSASSTPKSNLSTTNVASPSLSTTPAPFPDYLASLPNVDFTNQHFTSNLNIPTTLLPNAISPAHHDMLRSISMANARENSPTPLPPSFAQTAAGANGTKGVDQIANEMEELQRSIEALKDHGLNVNDFNFDDSYLNLPTGYDTDFQGLTTLNDGSEAFQDSLANSVNMDDLINTEHDELAFITPALGHQHISSGQATPIISTSSSVPSGQDDSGLPTTSVSAPSISMSAPATPATTSTVKSSAPTSSPVTSSVTRSSLSVPSSSVQSPASTLFPYSTAPSTPLAINRRMSTVGDEDMEELFEMD